MSKVKAGAAYVELLVNNSGLNKGLAAARKQLEQFGRGAAKVGGMMMAGGSAVLAPLAAATTGFAAAGDEINKISKRTGIGVAALSELGYAAQMTRTPVDTLNEGLTEMVQRLGEAAVTGTGSAADQLKLLGLSAEELMKQDPVTTLGQIADAINALPTQSERVFAIDEIFGGDGRQMIDLLAQGTQGIAALRKEGRDLGVTASPESIAAAAELTDAFTRIRAAIGATIKQIGSALAPALIGILEPLTRVAAGTAAWVAEHKATVVAVAKVAAGVVAAGAVLVGLGSAFVAAGAAIGGVLAVMSAVGAAIGVIKIVIGALLTPVGLVAAAVVGLGGYLLHTSGAGAAAIGWLSERFHELRAVATESFGAIGKALAAGDVRSAAKVLWLTLKMEWLKGVTVLKAYWQGFSDWFRSAAASMINGIAGVIIDGWAGIETAWTETIGFLADTWSLFTGALAKTWHNTVGFIKKAWVRLKSLFDSDIDVDAEVRRIDGETSAKTAAANERMLGAIGDRGRDRAARRTEIEQERKESQDALASMHAFDEAQRAAAGRAAVDRAAAELDVAKREWKDAIAAVQNAPAVPPIGAARDSLAGPAQVGVKALGEEETSDEYTNKFLEDFSARLAASGQAVAVESKAIESRSAFNAFSIRGLGADSLSDRQLRAAERTATNTEKLITAVKESVLVYG